MASTYTTNLHLEKPDGNDDISVLAINGNSDKIDEFAGKYVETRAGIASYSGLKGGGWADRVNVQITFSSPMPSTAYDVFATVAGAYSDFPFIKCTPDGSANTVNGTNIIVINSSGSSAMVEGVLYWFAIMRH